MRVMNRLANIESTLSGSGASVGGILFALFSSDWLGKPHRQRMGAPRSSLHGLRNEV